MLKNYLKEVTAEEACPDCARQLLSNFCRLEQLFAVLASSSNFLSFWAIIARESFTDTILKFTPIFASYTLKLSFKLFFLTSDSNDCEERKKKL